MLEMYWKGVTREVALLVRTLQAWREERFIDVQGEDEDLHRASMQGFQTFIERAVGEGKKERVQVLNPLTSLDEAACVRIGYAHYG